MNSFRPQRTTRRGSILSFVLGGVTVLLAFEAWAGPLGVFRQQPLDPNAEARQVTARGGLLEAERSTIALFQQASPAVVHIRTTELRRSMFARNATEIPQGSGSGFVWDSNGYLVTNYHVIRNSNRILVTLADGVTTLEAQLVGFDSVTDLAVLKIEVPRSGLPELPLGTSDDLQVGQNVYAIGNPFGYDQTLTTGTISGLHREILSVVQTPIRGVIQTDAAINPGNSGGPLLDSSGRLIGVNTAIHSPSGGSDGIGFAVPVDTINRVIPQIIQKGHPTRPTLGVYLAPDSWARRQRIDGVVLSEIRAGGPADRAGLRAVTESSSGRVVLGDIIVGINGVRVHSEKEFVLQLAALLPGEEVVLDVLREGKRVDVQATLDAFEE